MYITELTFSGVTFYTVRTILGEPEKVYNRQFDAQLRLDLLCSLDMEI